MIIKIIYTFFLALLIALFVGLGIDAFYPGPEYPKYPSALSVSDGKCEESPEHKALREDYDRKQEEFENKSKLYNRNVSIVSLSAAIIVLILSLTFLSKIKMIADGILLGGVFTTAYSIIRGLMSEDSRFRFLIVTIGLLIALILGYIKFIRPRENNKEK